jgi:polysaccharide pyruvyl transferase CsaB
VAKILISGWYGFGNLGDEAILSAIVHSLKNNVPNADVRVFSFRLAHTRAIHHIEVFRHPPQGILSWIKGVLSGRIWSAFKGFIWCDVLLLGGGGFLSDWQPEAPWVWLRQALIARLLGKKVMLYGIGAGPFSRPFGKWLTRTIINRHVNAITVRDEASREWLEKAGVAKKIIEVTADPAINLPSIKAWPCRGGVKKVGICVAPIFHLERHWPGKYYKYERFVDGLAETVRLLAKEGFEVFFIPMQASSDIAFAEEIIAKSAVQAKLLDSSSEIGQAVTLLAKVDVLIALRLHAAILGAIQGIPPVGIIYNHKVDEFLKQVAMDEYAEELGDGSVWREADINPHRLVENVKVIAANYPAICANLNARVSDLQRAEKGNIRKLNELLSKKG